MDSLTLWQEIYAPKWAALREREQALREQAFIDWESVVLGERIRQITLGDMLMLQGAGNPFIAGGGIPEAADVVQFLWLLHVENRGNLFRRGWHLGRMKARILLTTSADPLATCREAIRAYLADVFQDAPKGSGPEKRPLGVCFMASILTRLSGAIGTVDPATGKPWASTPMARIFQYIKAINREEFGDKFKDFSPSDKIMSDWLEHSNRLSEAKV
jgi:hypothetical protein